MALKKKLERKVESLKEKQNVSKKLVLAKERVIQRGVREEEQEKEKEEKEDESMNSRKELMNIAVKKAGLGSTIFIETEAFVELLCQIKACRVCGRDFQVTKEGDVRCIVTHGLDVTLRARCVGCKGGSRLQNFVGSGKSLMTVMSPYSAIFSGSTHTEVMRVLMAFGLSVFTPASSFYGAQDLLILEKIEEYAKRSCFDALRACIAFDEHSRYLKVTSDFAWSHRRDASQGTCTVLSGIKIPAYRNTFPIVAYRVIQKGRTDILKSDYDGSSKMMEHAAIDAVMTDHKFLEILGADLKGLMMAIDGDLESKNTFYSYPIIYKCFSDFSHRNKNLKNVQERRRVRQGSKVSNRDCKD